MSTVLALVHECVNDGIIARLLASILERAGLKTSRRHALGKAEALKRAEKMCAHSAASTCIAVVDLDPGAPLPRDYRGLEHCMEEIAYGIYACKHGSTLVLAFKDDVEDWLIKLCNPRTPLYTLKTSHKLFERELSNCEKALRELETVAKHIEHMAKQ